MRNKVRVVLPGWSRTLETRRRSLHLSQSELGKKLETSAMTISRWERDQAEPPANAHIRLGRLAGYPLCWFFWGGAGLSTADLLRVLPATRRRWTADRIPSVQVEHAVTWRKRPSEKPTFVAVPLLPVRAATPGSEGDKVADLDQVKPEAILAAPIDGCPNPAATLSVRVIGNSMSPLILDGSTISWPTTVPLSRGVRPSYLCKSLPQMPLVVTRSRASVGDLIFGCEWLETDILRGPW
jgi:transcriptional regulator with XRE-family HTH domain